MVRAVQHMLVTILALGVGGMAGCDARRKPVSAPAAAPRVTVQRPETRELLDEDEYNGWLQPVEVVEVRSRVRGHVGKVHFQDGEIITKDKLLFELDPRPFESNIAQAMARAKAIEAQKVVSEKDLARTKELRKTSAASQQELDKAEATVLSYAAQIAAVMQEVEQARLDLEYSKIKSPIGGRLSRALLTPGNLVNAGGSDPVLTTIVSIDPIQVYFNVDERALLKYRAQRLAGDKDSGQKSLRDLKISFRFRGENDTTFPYSGWLDFAENRIDANTGTLQVRGIADNKKGSLLPGSRVRVRIPASDKYQATLVPESAILSDQEKKYLLVLDSEFKVLRRDIVPGRLLDDGMRVLPGAEVKPEEYIVVLGLQRARINYPVEPFDAQGKAVANTGTP